MREPIPAHWHIAPGLIGYEPDGYEPFSSVEEMPDVLNSVMEELDRDMDALDESMGQAASEGLAGELLRAFLVRRYLREVSITLGNFQIHREGELKAPKEGGRFIDPTRVTTAPGFSEELWTSEARRYLEETFPLSVSYNTKLHVWHCSTPSECEHWAAEA